MFPPEADPPLAEKQKEISESGHQVAGLRTSEYQEQHWYPDLLNPTPWLPDPLISLFDFVSNVFGRVRKNMRFRKAKKESMDINMTALVDIMFILIIFLLVTAHYSKIASLKVSLPKASSAQTSAEEVDRVVVTLMADGTIHMNENQVTEDELSKQLSSFKKENLEEQLQVVIRADRTSQTGLLVRVMDIASKEGLTRISIEAIKGSSKLE